MLIECNEVFRLSKNLFNLESFNVCIFYWRDSVIEILNYHKSLVVSVQPNDIRNLSLRAKLISV